jgi:hypothetical protein
MNEVSRLWPLPLGFLAGILAVPFLFRWLLLLLASLGKLPPNLGTPSQRPRRVGVVQAIVHPVPWLLVLVLTLGIPRTIASPVRAEWVWFLIGAVAAPCLNAALVYAAVRRVRAKRRRETTR